MGCESSSCIYNTQIARCVTRGGCFATRLVVAIERRTGSLALVSSSIVMRARARLFSLK